VSKERSSHPPQVRNCSGGRLITNARLEHSGPGLTLG
jgi:hypothetical protein